MKNRFEKVDFYPEYQAKKLIPMGTEAMISIVGSGCNQTSFYSNWDHLLRLEFDDILYEQMDCVLFSKEQAIAIVDFVDNLPEVITHINVHCAAGISRSAAVAEFIRRHYTTIEKLNRFTGNLNDYVYRILQETFYERHG